MVVVRKQNGDVSICVDLWRLNREVRRERCVLPNLEDMVSKLVVLLFSPTLTLLRDTTTSSLIQTVPNYRSSSRRMGDIALIGILSASEIFHRRMTEMLEDIDGI